jgi:hypothetical protein
VKPIRAGLEFSTGGACSGTENVVPEVEAMRRGKLRITAGVNGKLVVSGDGIEWVPLRFGRFFGARPILLPWATILGVEAIRTRRGLVLPSPTTLLAVCTQRGSVSFVVAVEDLPALQEQLPERLRVPPDFV